MRCCFFAGTPLGLLLVFWRVLCLSRGCAGRFASKVPTCLPADGHAADLVTEGVRKLLLSG